MRRDLSVFGLAAALYILLTAVLTWPLPLHMGSRVPSDLGDPLLNTFLMAWNARTLPLTDRWWNLPMFYPIPGVMAFSEHLLGLSVLTTPIVWVTGNALLAYNVAFCLSFVLCGLGAHLLVWVITRRHDLGVIAGLAFAFAPYRMSQFAHVQVLSAYYMPLSLAGLHLFFQTRRNRWLALFAIAWLLQALACGYYLFYLSTLIGFWLLWFAIGRERWADVGKVLAAWAVAVGAMVPVGLGYLRFQGAYGLKRWPDEIESFSADILSVLNAAYQLRLWGWLEVVDRPESDLFPGLAVVVVTLGGLALGWRSAALEPLGRLRAARVALAAAAVVGVVAATPLLFGPWRLEIFGVRLLSVSAARKPFSLAVFLAAVAIGLHPSIRAAWKRRSPLAFYALATVAMWIFSLGPSPTFMNERVLYNAPYAWLMRIPGVDGVRVPARFWVLATLCLAVACALALAHLIARWPRMRIALPVTLGALLLIEAWPTPLRLILSPAWRPAVTRGAVRLALPLQPAHDPITLYRWIENRRPTFNGYSGYFAPHYWSLGHLLDQHEPAVFARLAALAPVEIVVDHYLDPDARWRAFVQSSPLVQRVEQPNPDFSLYRLSRATASGLPAVDGQSIPIAAITASLDQDRVGLMTDGDRITRWHTGGPQDPTNEITVDLGAPRDVRGVVMYIAGYVADFPRQLTIETSADEASWTPAWSGAPALLAFSAALEEPLDVPLPFPFEPRTARFVRFRQTGTEATYYWSIAELKIMGR
jgi:hypothetical protein